MENVDLTIIISALISLVVSVAAYAIQRFLNHRGKLWIDSKLVAPHIAWFRIDEDRSGQIQIHIPITLDVYNSSQTTKVMRNISMRLLCDRQRVLDMSPVNMIQYSDPREGKSIDYLGSDAGVYSFSIPENGVFSTWLMFVNGVSPERYDEVFDAVSVSFTDYHGKERSFIAFDLGKKVKLGAPCNFPESFDIPTVTASFR